MDSKPLEEGDTVIDIEGCVKGDRTDDEIAENKEKDRHLMIPVDVSEVSNENRTKKYSMSAKNKKPPKPPRPPRGLLLDAADQKLIKEIAELAMIKRARIERIKALKKMKATKASSSSSSSSSGNLIAILFTIAFCVLFILQGCHSSLRHRSGVSGSVKSNGLAEPGDIYSTLPANGVALTSVESPNVMELVPGSDSKDETREAAIQ